MTPPNKQGVHFFYPSSRVACGAIDLDSLTKITGAATHNRAEVTCEGCLEAIEDDKKICARCRGEGTVHTCDPALA